MENGIRFRRVTKGAALLALCAVLASSIEGCTAIGYAVGAGADSRAGKGGPELLTEARVGRPVTLFLRDGRRLEGRFAGWKRDPADASSAPDSLPPPGESVRLATSGGEVTIPAREVARVSVSVSRGKVTGLLVGAVADALALAVAALAMEGMVASALGQ